MDIYRRIEYKAGETIEVIETYPGHTGRKMTREHYKGRTPEAMKRYNEKLQTRRLTRLINTNFKPNDYFITLHYTREQRPEPEKAAAQLTCFLRSLKRLYRKHGKELKYIRVTAYGSKGGIHHHIVVNNVALNTDLITALWKYSIRTPDYTPLYSTGEYSGLAAYLMKQSRRSADGSEQIIGKRYSGSRNLKQPEIISDKYIQAIKWREPPTPKKGYIIDIDSIEAGINELNGRPFLFYRQTRAETEQGRTKNKEYIRANWKALSPYGKIIKKVLTNGESVAKPKRHKTY